MTAAASLLVKIIGASLRAIAPDGKEDVYIACDEIVDGLANIHRAARRAQDGAALSMNAFHKLGRDFHRFHATVRI